MPCAFIKNPAARKPTKGGRSAACDNSSKTNATAIQTTPPRAMAIHYKVHCLNDTNFGSGIKVKCKVVRICLAYRRGNEVATFLESLPPLRREG